METVTVAIVFFSLCLMPCLALIAVLLADSRAIPRRAPVVTASLRPATVEQPPTASPAPAPRPADMAPRSPEHALTGARGRVLAAYLRGLEATGTNSAALAPDTTFRELLKSLTPLPPDTGKLFDELTALVETALYSAREVDGNMAARAEQLADTIRQNQVPTGMA